MYICMRDEFACVSVAAQVCFGGLLIFLKLDDLQLVLVSPGDLRLEWLL